MSAIPHLSKGDLSNWLEVLVQMPNNAVDLMTWIEGPLRNFFPFGRLFAAHAEVLAGQVDVTHWRSTGHEQEYLQQLAMTFELSRRPSLANWLCCREPFFIADDEQPHWVSKFEMDEIERFRLGNVAAHGALNAKATAGTYFSFTNIKGPMSYWHLDALRLIAPVLNQLFLKLIVARVEGAPAAELTTAQLSICRLVAAGQCNKTIARTLGITDKTVRNQLTHIFSRLGVRSRTQLSALLR